MADVRAAARRRETSRREAQLYRCSASYESILVAYSGGVDSAYLAWAANRARPGQVLCVTADSPSYPAAPSRHGRAIAREFHLPHEFIHTSELERPEYRANPANRCYHCKTELYEHLGALAARPRLQRRLSTAATPTIAATTGPAGRRPASSACRARSTRPG